nr:hypothetical protein [Tanacetum cinerariifolium]
MQRGITVSYENWIHHGKPYDDLDDTDYDMPISEDSDGDNDMDDDDLDEMLNNIGESRGGVNWHSSGESSSTLDKDVETLHKEWLDYQIILFMLDIFRKALPTPSLVAKNFYEDKKYVRDLGFYGEKIHACVNDCVLYRNKYKSYTQCLNIECKEPRYKDSDSKVPQKVLRYFPLKPRLRRLFIDKQVACEMRWHKEKRVNDENIIRHLVDSAAWKHLDRV